MGTNSGVSMYECCVYCLGIYCACLGFHSLRGALLCNLQYYMEKFWLEKSRVMA